MTATDAAPQDVSIARMRMGAFLNGSSNSGVVEAFQRDVDNENGARGEKTQSPVA